MARQYLIRDPDIGGYVADKMAGGMGDISFVRHQNKAARWDSAEEAAAWKAAHDDEGRLHIVEA